MILLSFLTSAVLFLETIHQVHEGLLEYGVGNRTRFGVVDRVARARTSRENILSQHGILASRFDHLFLH